MSKIFSEFTQEEIYDRVLNYIDNNEDINEIIKWIDQLDKKLITDNLNHIILFHNENEIIKEVIKYILRSDYDLQGCAISLIVQVIPDVDILRLINNKYHDNIQNLFIPIMHCDDNIIKYALNNDFFDLTPNEILVKMSSTYTPTHALEIFLEIESLDNISQKALNIALHNYSIKRYDDVIKILLDLGGNFNAVVNELNITNSQVYVSSLISKQNITIKEIVNCLEFIYKETGIKSWKFTLNYLFHSIAISIKNLSPRGVEIKLIDNID